MKHQPNSASRQIIESPLPGYVVVTMSTVLKIATFNIQYSLGADGIYDLARCIDAVRNADVICLQEIDRNWQRTNMADQAAEVEALLPDRYCVFSPILDVDASSVDASGRVTNRRRQAGQMIISRFPILSSRFVELPKIDTGDMPNSWCGMHEAVIVLPDSAVRVVNVHLTDVTRSGRMVQVREFVRRLHDAPIEGGAWNGTDPDAESRAHWQLDDNPPPMPYAAVVVGDFNDVPTSPVYDTMCRSGFRDSWSTDTALTPYNVTFKTNPPQGTFEDMRIDFIFVNDAIEVLDAVIDAECPASDHQPVWATIKA